MTTKKNQLFLIIAIILGLLNFNCSVKTRSATPHISKYYVTIVIKNNSSQEVEIIDGFDGVKHNYKIKPGESAKMEVFGDDDETKDSPFKIVFGNYLQLNFKNGNKIKYYCRRETDKKCNVKNNPLSAKNYTSEFLGEKDFGFIIQLQYQLTYEITEEQLLKAK